LQPERGLVRFVYSSNPFYILSADLVFVGLRISFGTGGPASRTWAHLLGLGGYTLLMATTACVLIRLGKLWDDLRSLVLLIVMMLLAMALVSLVAVRRDGHRTCRTVLHSLRFLSLQWRGTTATTGVISWSRLALLSV
jgi:hypothetical protein